MHSIIFINLPIWFWKIMYIPDRFNHLYGIPLIMEVGSLNTKIGFAGKDRPDVIAPSVPFFIIPVCTS